MAPSSRTPEGEPNRCPVCGKSLCIEPSRPPGDAPCPHCGCLIWFEQASSTRGDRGAVEESKRTIHDWVRHIAELSKSEVSPPVYFRELVDGVVRCLAARGGAIWLLDDEKLRVRYRVGLDNVGLPQDGLLGSAHVHLVETVLATGAASATLPRPASRNAQEQANPTNSLVLLCPLLHAHEPRGVVEVFQRTEAGPAVQRGYLRFLTQICEVAGQNAVFRSVRKRPWWRFWR